MSDVLKNLHTMTPHAAARALIGEGAVVMPCAPRDKAPLRATNHVATCEVCRTAGFTAASGPALRALDLDEVDAVWQVHPDANVGITGYLSGLLWLDIDSAEGVQWWDDRCAAMGLSTLVATTPGKPGEAERSRLRVVFAVPASVGMERLPTSGRALRGEFATRDIEGVRAYCTTGYVVLPPSIHPVTGTQYGAFEGDEIAEVPQWLLDLIQVGGGGGAGRVRPVTGSQHDQLIDFLSAGTIPVNLPVIQRVMAACEAVTWAGPGNRHDTTKHALAVIVAYGAKQLIPLRPYLDHLREVFVSALAAERDAEREFDDMVRWTLGAEFDVNDPVAFTDLGLRYEIEKQKRSITARRIAIAELAAEEGLEPPEPFMSAQDIIDSPPAPVEWVVDGLMSVGSRIGLIAQPKTGKTTMALNLSKALITGEKFLGRYEVNRLASNESVVFMDYEVNTNTFRGWVEKVGIRGNQFYRQSLRGRVNPFTDAAARTAFIDQLKAVNCRVLIVDPFADAFAGGVAGAENDNTLVAAFFAVVNQVAEAAGVGEVVITIHAGWSAEGRARGASALEGKPDAMWYLTNDPDADERLVYFRARGRDVDVEQQVLAFDEEHLSQTVTGKSKQDVQRIRRVEAKEMRMEGLLDDVVSVVAREGAPTAQVKIIDALGGRKELVREALKRAVGLGLLDVTKGPRNALLYTLPSSAPRSDGGGQ